MYQCRPYFADNPYLCVTCKETKVKLENKTIGGDTIEIKLVQPNSRMSRFFSKRSAKNPVPVWVTLVCHFACPLLTQAVGAGHAGQKQEQVPHGVHL